MNLTTAVDRLRGELLTAAAAGGDDARALADRLLGPLDSATRLVLLETLSTAADEITRELAPGSVQVVLRGREPDFIVRVPPGDGDDGAGLDGADAELFDDAPLTGPAWPPTPATPTAPTGPDADDGATSRINLRLPDSLKARVEQAAGRERLSVNAWLVRAAAAALDAAERDDPPPRRARRGSQHYTGWVR